jgi:beta-N-acetylhexosaminidase
MTREEWDATYGKIWKAAVDAGARTFMVSHNSFPAVDDSLTPLGAPRPATASKKVLDILRKEMNYDGIIITDAVAMKAIASAFDHDDVYIECFNAGNDIVLFVHDDYIDVMEKAVLDGRVSMERLDESVQRILDFKESLGLFEEKDVTPALTDKENAEFDALNYEIAKSALTLINNKAGSIPFDSKKIKNAIIVAYSPYEPFVECAKELALEFERRGIKADIVTGFDTKEDTAEAANKYDLIIYAAYLAMSQPTGMPLFSSNFSTLFNAFAYGAEKSVAVSFGAPSIYYNYFETATAYVNAYSMDKSTMKAFVGAILGDFEMTAKSPVALKPAFAKKKYF